jgi:hypothetical protein
MVTVSFPVTVAYDNLVFFEIFYEYMNFIYGDLELNVKVSPNALVWCCVDPKYSLAHGVETSKLEAVIVQIGPNGNKIETDISTILLDKCAKNISIKSEADVYTKKITQVNSWGRVLINVVVSSPNPVNTTTLWNFAELVTAGYAQLKMAPVETLVSLCESYIMEYNLKQETKQPMINLCRNKPLVIPCEKFDYVYFNGMYNSSGINRTVTTNFINTKAVAMLYPPAISNLSCHQNPLMIDLTLQIHGRSYPYTPGNSLLNELIKQNMEAAVLNDYFHSTQSVEDSQCKGPPQAWGVRGRLDSDNTD